MKCGQSDIFVLRKHGLISGVYNVILVQTCLEIILPHQNVQFNVSKSFTAYNWPFPWEEKYVGILG